MGSVSAVAASASRAAFTRSSEPGVTNLVMPLRQALDELEEFVLAK
jgi:hypothetical protein